MNDLAKASAFRVLVVDDERLLHNVLSRLLGRHGMTVTSCTSGEKALAALEEQAFDLVITDFQMPEMDGLELLAQIREREAGLPVIMMTGHASVQHAVRAMSKGAVDYLPKPFTTEILLECVQRHLETRKADSQQTKAAPRSNPPASPKRAAVTATSFIGEHASITSIKNLVPRVARSKAAVFLHGESGTGKEVMARLVHDQSDRAGGPFIAINCANLPAELVESHLFGHKKGAFTGATETVEGAFARADGGTILLDEVTEIALPIQAKLLRVLQEEEFQQVGSGKTTKIDVRVVATSNRDLQEAIRAGEFREDLYHRLAVFPLFVPPLRDRRSDISLLVTHFVEKYCTIYGLSPKTVDLTLLRQLETYRWPGNVRELGNMIHRGVVLAASRSVIEKEDVINAFFSGGPGMETPSWLNDGEAKTLDEVERMMILNALEENDYNQERAAEQLGISARTIRNKLKRYREDGLISGSLRRTG